MEDLRRKRKDFGEEKGQEKRSLRPRREPTLQSLTVSWSIDKNSANQASFHVVTRAAVNNPSSEVVITQKVRDGVSITSGPTGSLAQFQRTTFGPDADESISTSLGEAIYDDKPGISTTHNITAATDLKYVFGARWKVKIGDTVLASTTPLYGIIEGAFVDGTRTFTPDEDVTATWNNESEEWEDIGTLVEDFPGWGTYPVPEVDND